jgi:zinc/manganese transport system substrate-binding protein
MRAKTQGFVLAILCIFSLGSCSKAPGASGVAASRAVGAKKSIVVSYSVLGSLVRELVGEDFQVKVSIPNGLDVHEWEPSAKDIESINKAELVVVNGLGLEGGMEKALNRAKASGVRFFIASDHIAVRHVGPGEGIPSGDPDQAIGAADPHIWTNPLVMKSVVDALAVELKADFGRDYSAKAAEMDGRLDALDAQIKAEVAALPEGKRKLVTGHESLGYFAQAYGFKLVGAVVPSLSSEAESSAAELSALKDTIRASGASVIFSETGTPRQVVDSLAKEAGVKTVQLGTHALPADGSYYSFERELAGTILEGLR